MRGCANSLALYAALFDCSTTHERRGSARGAEIIEFDERNRRSQGGSMRIERITTVMLSLAGRRAKVAVRIVHQQIVKMERADCSPQMPGHR